ncbi:hypothetical protein [Pontibacter beigongshangensis]|uniref:hypothetical protein n=1 Tax=Pontibacter beigongshangensis TaxID=2574733 RepID=UPI0016505601|nr:hypothetical protein [Pontibacter beigongshangensis]
MQNFKFKIPPIEQLKLQELLRWTQLRQEQVAEAILITKDTILGFVKRQAEKGNWKEVEQVLKGKPMSRTAGFLANELKDRVVQNLIFRLGLRRIIALALAMVLLPFLLAKISGTLICKFREKGQKEQAAS